MLSIRNRIHGLGVGGLICDSMGALSSYEPDINITRPLDACLVGIKPGYWTEPSGLWYARLEAEAEAEAGALEIVPKSCTGIVSDIGYPILSKLVQCSVYCIKYRQDYNKQLLLTGKILGSDDILCINAVKLWTSLIDGVLHQASKKSLLKSSIYEHLDLVPELYCVLEHHTLEHLPEDLKIMSDVLMTFRTTNSFVEGLNIINTSSAPSWAGALYGQLAGAYYGLTDIPEDWMDHVECSEEISKLLTHISKVIS